MKICLANDSFPPVIDGVANTVLNYAEIIHKKYGDVVVATPSYPNVVDDYPFDVVRYQSINTQKIFGYRAGNPFSPKAHKALDAHKPEIIHSHCPVVSTMLARQLRETTGAPVIMTYHTKFDIDIRHAIKNRIISDIAIKQVAANIAACDEVWVVSKGAGENLRSLGYEGDYIIMENGVDLEKRRSAAKDVDAISTKYGLRPDVPVFLFVGRMMWYKGIKILADGVKRFSELGNDFRLIMVGKGDELEEIKSYINEIGIGDRTIFTGPIYDREELRVWYTRADLFLFPSTYDTNGLVVREAAACSLASLLVKDSCASEGVVDGVDGVLVEENSESICDALVRVTSVDGKMAELGETAAANLYISWETSVDRAYERYNILLDRIKSGGNIHKNTQISDDMYEIIGDVYKILSKTKEIKRNIGITVGDGLNRAYGKTKNTITKLFDHDNSQGK